MSRVTDTRIVGYEPLLSPSALFLELPLGDAQSQTVETTRAEVRAVLDGTDDRLLVVTGPCSVHDPKAALEYAARLAELRTRYADDLMIVMRVYFEKPRTVTGWKGLINDPGMDGTYDVHRGLRTARRLLLDIVSAGLPVGCEWLDPLTPHDIPHTGTRGAGDREPGPRPARLGPVDAGRVQERHRRRRPGRSRRLPRLGGQPHVLQRDGARRRGGGDDHRQHRHARDPARRPQRPQLPAIGRGQGAGPDHGGRPAAPDHGRRQPRQQRQGLPPPDGGGRVA